jgi:hypothetical protein
MAGAAAMPRLRADRGAGISCPGDLAARKDRQFWGAHRVRSADATCGDHRPACVAKRVPPGLGVRERGSPRRGTGGQRGAHRSSRPGPARPPSRRPHLTPADSRSASTRGSAPWLHRGPAGAQREPGPRRGAAAASARFRKPAGRGRQPLPPAAPPHSGPRPRRPGASPPRPRGDLELNQCTQSPSQGSCVDGGIRGGTFFCVIRLWPQVFPRKLHVLYNALPPTPK